MQKCEQHQVFIFVSFTEEALPDDRKSCLQVKIQTRDPPSMKQELRALNRNTR